MLYRRRNNKLYMALCDNIYRNVRKKIMLLAVDVGNTDVTFGVFDGERLAARFRFTVQVPRTSDE